MRNAEVAVPRDLFAAILERISRLCLSPAKHTCGRASSYLEKRGEVSPPFGWRAKPAM